MNFKKRVNGSWTDTPHYIHKADTDILTTLPAEIYANDTTATVGLKGDMVQSSQPSPTSPVMPQETGDKTANLFSSTWESGNINSTTGQNETSGIVCRTKDYIPVTPNTIYSMKRSIYTSYINIRFYRADKTYIGGGSSSTINIIVGSRASNPMIAGVKFCVFELIDTDIAYMRINDDTNNVNTRYMMVEGQYTSSTMPTYEPCGYKIPISSSGENLFDLSSYFETTTNISDIIIGENGITYNASAQLTAIKYKFNLGITDVYTISLGGDSVNTRLELRCMKNGSVVGNATVIQPNQNAIVRGSSEYDEFSIYISNGNYIGTCTASNIMLNTGSEALPYSPYNRTTTPVYLGEVQSTRRIRKLVLDGTESWKKRPHNNQIHTFELSWNPRIIKGLCSHYAIYTAQYIDSIDGIYLSNTNAIIITDLRFNTTADFKVFLAAQYAAGTPVTVWYVLATPETGIINEPLRKIGDYADEVSGITIPTIAGANTLSVDTTLQPSEVTVNYKGWHPVADVHEADNGAWT